MTDPASDSMPVEDADASCASQCNLQGVRANRLWSAKRERLWRSTQGLVTKPVRERDSKAVASDNQNAGEALHQRQRERPSHRSLQDRCYHLISRVYSLFPFENGVLDGLPRCKCCDQCGGLVIRGLIAAAQKSSSAANNFLWRHAEIHVFGPRK